MKTGARGLLLFTLLTSVTPGQVSTGVLAGSVTDPFGAAVIGATILIRDLDTGVSHTWTSNERGAFKIPFLRPGRYSLRVEADGFQTWHTEPLEILVGKEAAVDAALALGSSVESVTVAAAPPLVETNTAQAGGNFGAATILRLPRLSSGLDRLALLAPGVVATSGNLAINGTAFSANGQRPRSNAFLLDGQDNGHRIPGGPRFLFSTLEAVAEYQIVTNQFSAEYGLAQGSVVNVVTRGGANRVHGMTNWLHRNDQHMGALTNIQRRSGLSRPPKFVENRYGATLGGPLRKDKAFFFVYLENQTVRRYNRVEAGPGLWTPTGQGLTTLAEAFPESNTVAALLRYGPLTRSQGSPEFLPGIRRFDSVRSPVGSPVAIEMGRLVRYFNSPIDTLQTGARIDLDLSPRDRLNARYFHRESEDQSAAALSGYFVVARIPMRSAAVTWTRAFSTAFVNELRLGYDYDLNDLADHAGPAFDQMGSNIAEFAPPPGYLGFGLPNNQPQLSHQNSAQIADNASYHRGRHALKVGFQWTRLWSDAGSRPFYNGQFQFDTLQNFVDNRPLRFNGADGPLHTPLRFSDQAWYLQDDFRVRSDLTLNLGFRYELPSHFTRFAHEITTARERDPATAIWNPGLPLEARANPATRRDRNNWAPRVGFAWNPRGASWLLGDRHTAIRGGYGIGYDFPYGLLGAHVLHNAPFVLRYSLPGAAAPVPAQVTGDAIRRRMQPPRGLDPRHLVSAQFSPDLHSPMLHSWSLGIQRRLGTAQVLEIRYAGNRGLGLYHSRNANPNAQNYLDAGFARVLPQGVLPGVNPACATCTGRVDPNYAAYTVLANTASSTYHALHTRYQGRPLRELAIGAAYTFSRSLDNASDNDLRAGVLAQNPFDLTSGERGTSAFDLPHVLALHFVWDLPGFASRSGWMGRVFSGWSLAGVLRSSSGVPATPQQRNSEPRSANDLDFNTAFSLNPDTRRPFPADPRAPLHTLGLVHPDGSLVDFHQRNRIITLENVRWIYNNNAAARFIGTPWGAGRNVLRAPPLHQTDLSLFKRLRVTDRVTLELRLEAENALNHPNLGVGGTVADLPGFLNPTEAQALPRRVAAGLRLLY